MKKEKKSYGRQMSLEVTQQLIGVLYEMGIRYNQMPALFDCTEGTITNWRKGKTTPDEHSIRVSLERLPRFLGKTDGGEEKLIQYFRDHYRTQEAGGYIMDRLYGCDGIGELLEYLLVDYDNDRQADNLAEILRNKRYIPYIMQLLSEKAQLHVTEHKFFKVEKCSFTKEDQDNIMSMDPEACFVLKCSDSGSSYGYKVLVNTNFVPGDNTLHIHRNQHAVKRYNVNMMILLTTARLDGEMISFYVNNNIYVETVEREDFEKRGAECSFAYNTDLPAQYLVAVNRYCDLLWEKISKYFDVIFKNVIFEKLDTKSVEKKRRERGLLWEAKFATRHEINFECERIKELLGEWPGSPAEKRDLAVAIGFVSFPVVLMLRQYFRKVIFLDNAYHCVSQYEKEYKDSTQGEFSAFTSAVGGYITGMYSLYGNVDLVVVGAGYVSFLKNPSSYYKYINTWLKNEGIVYLSLYNSEFTYDYIDRITLNENMDFFPESWDKQAKVNINRMGRYHIYCDMGHYDKTKEQVSRYFEIESMFSYPMASLLVGSGKAFLQNILKELDKEYSRKGIPLEGKNFNNTKGCFLDVAARKRVGHGIRLVRFQEYEIHHPYSISRKAQFAALAEEGLREDGSNFVKVLICREDGANGAAYYLVVLPSNSQIPETEERMIDIQKKRLNMLTIAEVNELGFEIGNMSPFFECTRGIQWKKLYDKSISRLADNYIFTGSGRCDVTLKIPGNVFMKKLEEFGFEQF